MGTIDKVTFPLHPDLSLTPEANIHRAPRVQLPVKIETRITSYTLPSAAAQVETRVPIVDVPAENLFRYNDAMLTLVSSLHGLGTTEFDDASSIIVDRRPSGGVNKLEVLVYISGQPTEIDTEVLTLTLTPNIRDQQFYQDVSLGRSVDRGVRRAEYGNEPNPIYGESTTLSGDKETGNIRINDWAYRENDGKIIDPAYFAETLAAFMEKKTGEKVTIPPDCYALSPQTTEK